LRSHALCYHGFLTPYRLPRTVTENLDARPQISTTAWQKWRNRLSEHIDYASCPFLVLTLFQISCRSSPLVFVCLPSLLPQERGHYLPPSSRPYDEALISSVPQLGAVRCPRSPCIDVVTLLYVGHWEKAARVRVDRLRGSPKSHLLNHLTTIGLAGPRDQAPVGSCSLRPPSD